MSRPLLVTSPQARASYIAISAIIRRAVSTSARRSDSPSSGHFKRSDFSGQGFTGYYEAGGPTIGPLGDASAIGAPSVTPRVLKHHLDQYVIGQERAKKVLSVAVYNHHQRIQELQRREDEEEELLAQQARRAIAGRHPVENEFPGQQPTVNLAHTSDDASDWSMRQSQDELNIEKSNVLLLGPSGVGKTLMTKTLARILDVPFSISDCTPFTQAGYIGEDADVCVQRLLAAADYDVARAERGIICLDEIDKIATAKVSHGKDVSGEGVQQALLKIIEGTVVQVQAKQEKGSTPGVTSSPPPGARSPNAVPTSALGAGAPPNPVSNVNASQQGPQRGEVYNVDTSNILFICTGAFIGLHRLIMERIAKGSIGFGAHISAAPSNDDVNDPTIRAGASRENDELFRKNLPFYTAPSETFASASKNPSDTSIATHSRPSAKSDEDTEMPTYNTLDLAAPADLQKYGIIPELLGRIPVTCSLSQLSLAALVRILTEPRNALLQQYKQLFALSGIELRFTSPALYEVARTAQGMGTGARGLRTVMERLLSEAMFEGPGSGNRYCLVTEQAACKQEPVLLLGRGMQGQFQSLYDREEEQWQEKRGQGKKGGRPDDDGGGRDQRQRGDLQPGFSTFEEYRERVKIAGAGGAF